MLYVGLTNLLFLLRYALARNGAMRKQIYFVVLVTLFVFSAFRYQVGCDWSGYYNEYLAAANFEWSSITETQEPIWWAILKWIQDTGLPYPVANIASSAIFFLGVHVLARRQPDPLGFLVLLFPILIINLFPLQFYWPVEALQRWQPAVILELKLKLLARFSGSAFLFYQRFISSCSCEKNGCELFLKTTDLRALARSEWRW